MNLRYPSRGEQPNRASSNRIGEEGFCVTVIPCLVVARHGVFSIEEVSTVPLGKGCYSRNHEVRRGGAKVNVFMRNSNGSESSLVDSKLPL